MSSTVSCISSLTALPAGGFIGVGRGPPSHDYFWDSFPIGTFEAPEDYFGSKIWNLFLNV